MRKTFIFLFLIIFISLQVTGCTEQKTSNDEKENQKIETAVKKSDNDIREIAYQSLSEESKKTIVNWKDGKVEEYKSTNDHSVASPNGSVNIRDKYTYKVTFRTTNEAMLGPITIYLRKDSYNILGIDFRD